MTERLFKVMLGLALALGLVLALNLACSCDDDDDDDDDDDTAAEQCEDDYESAIIACVTAGSLKDISLCGIEAGQDLVDCLLAAGYLNQSEHDCLSGCIGDAYDCVALCGDYDYNCIEACSEPLETCYEGCGYVPPEEE